MSELMASTDEVDESPYKHDFSVGATVAPQMETLLKQRQEALDQVGLR